jgi:two-component system, LytTR family, response regulator
MSKLRILVVDDEPLVRRHLIHALAAAPDVEVVGEAGSKAAALKAVAKLRPDLMLLDIRMPGGDGFDLLDELADPPAVIFVTSHDHHALRAFEVNALDYVLKPVDPARLAQALDRARLRLRGEPPAAAPELDLGVGGSGHFLAVRDILLVESEGNYTHITATGGRRHVARQPIREWTRRLPAPTFVQLDRGLLINLSQARAIEFQPRGATLELGDLDERLSIGTTASTRLREVLRR